MNDALKPLLENDLLTDDVKQQITEAYAKQLDEAREEITVQLREEFTSRYEHDKGNLIEAIELMVEDGIQVEIAEFVEDRKSLTEQKVKLANEIRESRITAKKNLAEQMKLLETFILETLQKEISEFNADKVKVREAKRDLAKQIRESRTAYNDKLASNIELLEGFVFEQLKSEITEFQQDKKNLVEQRVKMVADGKAKINETRKQFIKRSANLVEATLDDVLTRELGQLKEDIVESRKKHFGMQMFEAFATEYKTTFFNENKEVNVLKQQIAESEAKLEKAKDLFEQAHSIAETAQKKQQLAEGRATRTVLMNELLGKLSGNQRDVMAELLESTKTKDLRSAFKKYIPAVTSGTGNTALTRASRTTNLSENKKTITGNKTNKLVENVDSGNDSADIVELDEMKRLAGL